MMRKQAVVAVPVMVNFTESCLHGKSRRGFGWSVLRQPPRRNKFPEANDVADYSHALPPGLLHLAAFHSLLHDSPLHILPGCALCFLISFALPMETR